MTYNTNTVIGAASSGPQAFGRVLTGFGYHGPDGQMVSDHDFGSIAVVGREPLVLDYQIADNAVYSDGKPDHLRRHGAGLGRPVGPVSRVRRGEPGRLHRHRHRRLPAGTEEGAGVVRRRTAASSTTASCSPPRR